MQNGYASSPLNLLGHFSLMLKEGMRGIRHVALVVRAYWVGLFKTLPTAIRQPFLSLVAQFDRLAERVDRETSKAAHHYLDPAVARDSETATFSKIILRDDAPVMFAKTSYDNLKLIVPYLSEVMEIEEKFFISEMLSACAYRKSITRFAELDDDSSKAGWLTVNLMRQGVIRTHNSTNAIKSPDPKISKLARISSFASMLWLVIARDYIPERERDLLYSCCDLALVIEGQIEDAGDDYAQLGELLRSHAEII